MHNLFKKIITLLFLSWFSVLNAQESESIKDLNRKLQLEKNDSIKLALQSEIADHYTYIQLDSTIAISERALKKAHSLNYEYYVYDFNIRIGNAYVNKGVYNLGKTHLNTALNSALKLKGQEAISRSYVYMGNAYYHENLLFDAFKNYKKALDGYRTINSKIDIVPILNNIGIIYDHVNDYDGALEYYLESLKICESIDCGRIEGNFYLNLGILYRNQKKFDLAIESLNKAYDNYIEHKDDIGVGYYYYNLGDVKQKQKKNNEAIVYLNEALDIMKKGRSKLLNAPINISLSKAYQETNINLSESHALIAFQAAKNQNGKNEIAKALRQLALIYTKKEHYKKANTYGQLHTTYNDSIVEEKLNNVFIREQIDFEIKEVELKKDLELAEVKRTNEQREHNLQLEKQRQKRLLLLSVLLIATLALVALFFYNLKLKKTLIEVEKLNKVKSNFLAKMSHELKTPLNAIIGFTDLISKKEKKYTKHIKQSANNLLALTEQILDFDTLKVKTQELKLKPQNIIKIVEDVISIFKQEVASKNLELEINLDKKIKNYTLCDKKKIKQIVFNLMSNALKYTNKGYIKIVVLIELETKKHYTLRFEIQDTGIGIKKENKHKILEAFYQEKKDENIKNSGVGLGLSIAQKLLQTMGSELNFVSDHNQGSTFSFNLKLEKDNKLIKEVKETTLEEDLSTLYKKHFKALVVEDNYLNLLLIKKILKNIYVNVEIIEATNGKIGVEKFKETNPDIVLMDLLMPIMNGFEASKEIKNQHNSKTPIIAVSANSLSNIESQMESSGIDDFIGKPINRKLIETKLNHYIINLN